MINTVFDSFHFEKLVWIILLPWTISCWAIFTIHFGTCLHCCFGPLQVYMALFEYLLWTAAEHPMIFFKRLILWDCSWSFLCAVSLVSITSASVVLDAVSTQMCYGQMYLGINLYVLFLQTSIFMLAVWEWCRWVLMKMYMYFPFIIVY